MVRSSGKTVAKGLLIGAVALLISGIAGCEAGNNAPTLEFHPASTGASTTFNGISINDVFVLGAPLGATVPAGSSASLFLSLYNGGTGDDELTGIHATGWASSVQVTGGTVSIPAAIRGQPDRPGTAARAQRPGQAAVRRRGHPAHP